MSEFIITFRNIRKKICLQYLESLGYCPQNDALNNILTGRQILTVVSNLRGLNNPNIVEQFLELFGKHFRSNVANNFFLISKYKF